jgi:hypothetical protein
MNVNAISVTGLDLHIADKIYIFFYVWGLIFVDFNVYNVFL